MFTWFVSISSTNWLILNVYPFLSDLSMQIIRFCIWYIIRCCVWKVCDLLVFHFYMVLKQSQVINNLLSFFWWYVAFLSFISFALCFTYWSNFIGYFIFNQIFCCFYSFLNYSFRSSFCSIYSFLLLQHLLMFHHIYHQIFLQMTKRRILLRIF